MHSEKKAPSGRRFYAEEQLTLVCSFLEESEPSIAQAVPFERGLCPAPLAQPPQERGPRQRGLDPVPQVLSPRLTARGSMRISLLLDVGIGGSRVETWVGHDIMNNHSTYSHL